MTSDEEIIECIKCHPIEKQLERGEKIHEIYTESYKDMRKLWLYVMYSLWFVTFLLLIVFWWKRGVLN